MLKMIRVASLAGGVVLICAASASAQGLGFGVKGGVNISDQNLTGDNAPSMDMRYAGVGGAFVTLPLAPWFGVQAEGLYSMKGAKVDVQGVQSSIQIDYAEIPVLGWVRFASRYHVSGGPSMAFALRARTRSSFGGTTIEMDAIDQVNRFDFGVAMGGGVQLGQLILDGRYTLGLTDIDKDKTDNVQTKNRTISVTAGFRF